jgi:hypothetical protein
MPGKKGIKVSRGRRHAQDVAIRPDYHRPGAQLGEIFFRGPSRCDDSDLIAKLDVTHGRTERLSEAFIRQHGEPVPDLVVKKHSIA